MTLIYRFRIGFGFLHPLTGLHGSAIGDALADPFFAGSVQLGIVYDENRMFTGIGGIGIIDRKAKFCHGFHGNVIHGLSKNIEG